MWSPSTQSRARSDGVGPGSVVALVDDDELDRGAGCGAESGLAGDGVQSREVGGRQRGGVVDRGPVAREVAEVRVVAVPTRVEPEVSEKELTHTDGVLEEIGSSGQLMGVEQGLAGEDRGDRVGGRAGIEEEARLDVEVVTPAGFLEAGQARSSRRRSAARAAPAASPSLVAGGEDVGERGRVELGLDAEETSKVEWRSLGGLDQDVADRARFASGGRGGER